MACSHFKCLTSHCVLGTSVPCQPGPGGSCWGREFLLPLPPGLPAWPVASSLWLEPRPCLSINITKIKPHLLGLDSCFSFHPPEGTA